MQKLRPQKLLISNKLQISNISLSPYPSSPRKRKNPTSFITQKPQEPYGRQVHQYHTKLNSQIDHMDQKIQKVIQKHEGQFILAYRNHVKKVRQQMDEIRKKANSSTDASSSQKVQMLQKQLIIFRQEALGLFDKITIRDLQLEQAKNRIAQLETEKRFNQQAIKKLMKKNKLLEASQLEKGFEVLKLNNINLPQYHQIHIAKASQTQNNPVFTSAIVNGEMKTKNMQSRPYTTAIGSRNSVSRSHKNKSIYEKKNNLSNFDQISDIEEKVKHILGQESISKVNQIIKLLNDELAFLKSVSYINTNKYPMRISQTPNYRTRRNSTGYWKNNICTGKQLYSKKAQSMSIKGQLQQFFYTCIENARKQIMRRRNIRDLNFYQGDQISIQQFKKIDTFRIIEMLVSNQRIIEGIYELIFGKKDKYFGH